MDDITWQDMISSRLRSTKYHSVHQHQQIWNSCMNYTREEDSTADEKELMKEIRVSNNTSCSLIDGVFIFLCVT